MRFEDFARQHGLIIREVIPHKWVSTPTEDHPKKRNGRYKFLGDVGWVQNWATMPRPSMWKSDSPTRSVLVYKSIQDAGREREEAAKKAAAKAGWILKQCRNGHHTYLEAKGFPDETGNIWDTDGQRLLVIPMRDRESLLGVQLINEQGQKKFLGGQRTKGAYFCIDAKGVPIFCEGYATALSVRSVMKLIKLRYTIYVCFSAGNIKTVANSIHGGFVIADNDPNGVGEQAARDTSKPYWLSDQVGEDFNDYHRRVGDFAASQSLKRILLSNGVR